MKKIIIILVIVTVAILCLVGCLSTETNETDNPLIGVWLQTNDNNEGDYYYQFENNGDYKYFGITKDGKTHLISDLTYSVDEVHSLITIEFDTPVTYGYEFDGDNLVIGGIVILEYYGDVGCIDLPNQ